MFKKIIVLVILFAIVSFYIGCMANMHKIGAGAQGNDVSEARQWYILFGLVPLNTVDTHAMAAGATDYDIKTEASALDIVMNIFTSYITVYSRTVTVTK